MYGKYYRPALEALLKQRSSSAVSTSNLPFHPIHELFILPYCPLVKELLAYHAAPTADQSRSCQCQTFTAVVLCSSPPSCRGRHWKHKTRRTSTSVSLQPSI